MKALVDSTTTQPSKYRFQATVPAKKVITFPASSVPSGDTWVSSSVSESLVITTGKQRRTIHDLGWTQIQAAAIRGRLGAFMSDDWDDPAMDIYDEVY